jgi:hypothetical protein
MLKYNYQNIKRETCDILLCASLLTHQIKQNTIKIWPR